MTTKAFIYKSLTSSKGSISLAPKMYVPRGQRSCNRACTIRGVSKSEVKGRHFLSFVVVVAVIVSFEGRLLSFAPPLLLSFLVSFGSVSHSLTFRGLRKLLIRNPFVNLHFIQVV